MIRTGLFFLFLAMGSSLAAKKFPASFKFGTAVSSYQTEGAWNEDGKGPSMWDTFVHIPGNIKNNDTADVACDSYHRYKEDVQILKKLGVKLYRFSLSWPRILPGGTPTKINQAGVDYYLNLLKELKANDIEPVITLYHWDLPQHLSELGGWLNPQIADYFADFARIAFKNFGPYVKYWVTLNEPQTTCTTGYGLGNFAPGLNIIGEGPYQCAKVHVLAHAKAYRVYEREFKPTQKGKVTININSAWNYAKTNSSLDREALQRSFDFTMGLFADPIFKGYWPRTVIDRVGNRSKLEGYSFSRLPKLTPEEIDLVNGTYDYFALNLYSSSIVSHIPEPKIDTPKIWFDQAYQTEADPSWPVPGTGIYMASDPRGIRHMLNYIKEKYNPSEIVITENGWSDLGELDDQNRIVYCKGYLQNILDAILEDGINVTGYTLWSLLDNFEWGEGYRLKYGIVSVDFNDPNRPRTWKSSAKWYQKVVAAREIVD